VEKETEKKLEILAPVGGQEQLIAAVRCGADAVYLGTKGFNARRNAENFSGETDLRSAVAYCHARNVRVHVTVNTLVRDDELGDVEETLRDIAAAGADAILIQDLAVAEMVRQCVPEIAMHASTQMAVHNTAGVKALEKLGFSRVVLARELTLEEIRAIAASTPLEVEAFVHGALCVSASGLCELSAMIGGRSGNRGLCAQPCRLDFKCRGRDHALSLKDMSYIPHIPELTEAGVASIKIEGRMKRPEYVAAAVTACRSALAGEPVDMDTLQAVFSRSGFTDGYLTGKRTARMFGYRTKEDVEAQQGVLKSLAGLYRAERQCVPVDMALRIKGGAQASLTAEDRGCEVSITGQIPEAARTTPMDRATAEKCLGKTGGTQFYLRNLSAELAPGLTLPVSELNRMRREALAALAALREAPEPKEFRPRRVRAAAPHEAAEPALRLRFEQAGQVFDAPGAELVILPVTELSAHPELLEKFGSRLAAEIPALVYPAREEPLRRALLKLRGDGLRSVVAENIGALALGRELGFAVRGGASLNILNSAALEQYEALGLADATVSAELSMKGLRAMGGKLPRGILAYGYLPLMKLRACPARGDGGCGTCRGTAVMTDRIGERFTILCREKQYSELLNCVPLYIGDKSIGGADFCTLYFTVESGVTCRHVTELFLRRGAPDFRRTGGLYFRDLL